MDNIKEQYYNKANNLMARLLGEAPEDEEETTPDEEAPDVDTPEADGGEDTESGQAEQVQVYFDDLDEDSQKVLLDALKENLNIAEDDDYAHDKLVDELSKEPIVTLRAETLVRKLDIDV